MGGYFHHRGGHPGAGQALDLVPALPYLGREDFGAAVAAKEHRPLVKDGQAADLHRPGCPDEGIGGDAVEEPHIHRIKPPVEGYRLHIDVRVHKLGAFGLYRLGSVDDLLGAPGGVHPQILHTVSIGR